MNAHKSRHTVYIHADESCLGNQFSDRANPGGAAGLIEVFDDKRGWSRRDYYVSARDTTNQRMALRSAIEGLRALKRPSAVVFSSDSKYLVTGMKEWVHNWATRGWKRKGGPIENLELWFDAIRAWQPHSIEWRWVRGHAGHPKNEYSNQLAIDAARKQKDSKGLVDSGFGAWLESRQEQGQFLDFFDLPPDQEFMPDRTPPHPPKRLA
jgi:ribonuclease HI